MSARVGRTAAVLTPIVLVARGVAFLTPVVIAHLFGATSTTDAFFYALAFPTFIMVIVANAVGTVAMPLMAEVQERDPDAMAGFVGSAALGGAVLAVAVGAMQLAVLWPALPYVTDFDRATQQQTWLFVLELVPFMALVGASVLVRSAAEVRGRFVPVAVAPLLRGATAIALIVATEPALGPHCLPLALGVAEAVQVLWYTAVLAHDGLWVRLTLVPDPRLRKAAVRALPLLGGEVLVATNIVVDKAFAGALPEGSVSLLEYADRVRFIPQALLESTLLPVAFATWANLAAAGRHDDYARQVDQSLRWVAAWTAAPLAGLYIGRHVLTSALFERGAFGPEDTAMAADAFGWYVPGLWTMMLGAMAMRAHVVNNRLRLVLGLGVLSATLNIALDAALVGPMGIQGLALASSLVWMVVPAGYLWALYPSVKHMVSLRAWLPVFAVAGGSLAVALSVELTGSTPHALSDSTLWMAALPCLALLAIGAWTTRPPRST